MSDIKVGTSCSFTNKEGSSLFLLFRQDCIILVGEEVGHLPLGVAQSKEKDNKSRVLAAEAELRFSYGVHPKLCPALWELGKAMAGEKRYRKRMSNINSLSERILMRESDYGKDALVIELRAPDFFQVQLNGSLDTGQGERIVNGGTIPRICCWREETPEVFEAIFRLAIAVDQDNRSRPFPKGWWL
jgi:hypothetical protein